MDGRFDQLCYACRIGDLESVDQLTAAGVSLHGVDKFNNSPLYLASLCGHEAVVKLLLARGAFCNRDTHEGARCAYGALTESIRSLLRAHDISKAVDLRQPFAMHISSLLTQDTSSYSDIKVRLLGPEDSLQLHRFILISRSAYFGSKFASVWEDKSEIDMLLPLFVKEFKLIINYVYLNPVLHLIEPEQIENMVLLCKKFGFPDLKEYLEKLQSTYNAKEKSLLMAEHQQKCTGLSRDDLSQFVEEHIIRSVVTFAQSEEFDIESAEVLANLAVHDPFCDTFVHICNLESGLEYIYPAHRAILTRSDYLKTVLTSPFIDSSGTGHLSNEKNYSVVDFPTDNPQVAEAVLKYLYYDETEIPLIHAKEILVAADALLLDRLKNIAAVCITTNEKTFLEMYSVYQILDVAWATQVERLEHFAARVIAYDLENYARDIQLQQSIQRSAERIDVRQATDTIELVDDIDYYLLEKHHLQSNSIEDAFFSRSDEDETDTYFMKDKKILNGILCKLGLSAFVPESALTAKDV